MIEYTRNNCRIRNLQTVFIRNLNYGSPKLTDENKIDDDYNNSTKLIDVNEHRILDSFFTLHYGDGSVFYISEICASSMNPNFNSISVPQSNGGASNLIIKVWIKYQGEWVTLIRWHLDLTKLCCISDTDLDGLVDNAVVFKVHDKLYTGSFNLSTPPEPIEHKQVLKAVDSYNFDTIRSINNLDKSLKELAVSKRLISKSIDKLISNKDAKTFDWVTNESKRLRARVEQASKYINTQKNVNDSIMSQIMNIKTKINDINELRDDKAPEVRTNFEAEIELVQNQGPALFESLESIFISMKQYFQDYGAITSEVIQIEKGKGPYDMAIMGIDFPTDIKGILAKVYEGDFEVINNCLSYITQLIVVLLDITDPEVFYSIEFKGNYSIIKDFNHQPYPLFYNPKLTKKIDNAFVNEPFETGLKLLNKNILLLTYRLNVLYQTFEKESSLLDQIPIDCLDNFLWNLEYLLLFMTKD